MHNPLNFLCEAQSPDLEYIVEESKLGKGSTHYLVGPFLMAESPNKNHRVYNLREMVNEVDRYRKEYIETNRAIGELNHPKNSTEVDPKNAAHMVTEMHQEGNMFYGKTKILSTPSGTIVKQLLSDGVRLGISSRALGNVETKGDVDYVNNLHLICLDLVHEPSAPAMLESIMENKQYLIAEGGRIVEIGINDLEKNISTFHPHFKEEQIEMAFQKFFDKLRGR